jgi:radical SAM superfamily enzyme YgiQ (UPF0313 family)
MGKDTYLVNPSDRGILENSGDRIPIGLLSIASNNPNTKIYDLNHDSEDKLLSDIQRYKPKTVGISVYTSAIYHEAVRLAKSINGPRTVAGGHHATAMAGTLLPYFDTVIQGEGELSLEIANTQDGIIKSYTPSLNRLRNINFSMLDMKNYNLLQSGKRTGTIISSRGCFGDCSFCGKLSNKVRYEPVNKILDQVHQLKEHKFEAIYFVDDIFTQSEKRMKEIVECIDMPYRVTTRADLLNRSKLELLSETGCDWISLGIESGNDEILRKSNKGMTTDQNYDAVKLANEFNIKTKGFFIIGLPGETERSARDTIDFSLSLKNNGLTQADFYYLCPFPGTPIWKDPEKFEIDIIDFNYGNYLQAGKSAKCVVNTKELSASRIESLVEEAKELWKN